MARKEVPLEPETLTCSHFAADGTETVRTGHVWAPAPAVRGQRALWVLDDDRRAWLAVRAARPYQPPNGRTVFRGEWFCVEPPAGPAPAPPTAIRVEPLSKQDMVGLSGL